MLNNYTIKFVECETTKKELNNIEILGITTILADLLAGQGQDQNYYRTYDEIGCQPDNNSKIYSVDCEYNLYIDDQKYILTEVFMDQYDNTDLFGIAEDNEGQQKQVMISLDN